MTRKEGGESGVKWPAQKWETVVFSAIGFRELERMRERMGVGSESEAIHKALGLLHWLLFGLNAGQEVVVWLPDGSPVVLDLATVLKMADRNNL